MQIDELVGQVHGVRLVVGTGQQDCQLRSVYTTDLVDPSRYLAGGELVLTSGLWASQADGCMTFVEALVESNVAALGFGIGQVASIPNELIARCRALGLPVLEVAAEVSFNTIAELILAERASARTRHLAGSLVRSRRLQMAAAEGGLAALLDRVSAEIRTSCWLLSPTGRVLGGADAAPNGMSQNVIAEHGSRPARARFSIILPERLELCVHLVPGGEKCWTRFLVCAISFERMTLVQRDLVEDAVRVLGVLDSSLLDAGRVGSESLQLLVDALDRDDGDLVEISTLQRIVGVAHCPELCVVLARSHEPGLTDVILADIPSVDSSAPGIANLAGDSARLIATGSEHALFQSNLLNYLRDIEPLVKQHNVRLGVGEIASSPSELRRSLLQARAALNAAETRRDTVAAVFAGELRSTHFLLANLAPELRAVYRRQVLGHVIEYDFKHHSGLEQTLCNFLDQSGSYRACAATMHLHVNTVRYRMQHVERLTGLSVTKLPDQVTLYMAVHATSTSS